MSQIVQRTLNKLVDPTTQYLAFCAQPPTLIIVQQDPLVSRVSP